MKFIRTKTVKYKRYTSSCVVAYTRNKTHEIQDTRIHEKQDTIDN